MRVPVWRERVGSILEWVGRDEYREKKSNSWRCCQSAPGSSKSPYSLLFVCIEKCYKPDRISKQHQHFFLLSVAISAHLDSNSDWNQRSFFAFRLLKLCMQICGSAHCQKKSEFAPVHLLDGPAGDPTANRCEKWGCWLQPALLFNVTHWFCFLTWSFNKGGL